MHSNIKDIEVFRKKSKKKICFLMPIHPLVGKGGAEYQAKIVLEEIVKESKYDIHFIAKRTPVRNTNDHKVWKVGFFDSVKSLSTLIDIPFVYYILNKIKPDVIYQNVGGIYTGVAAFYANRHNSKLVWHIASDADVDHNILKKGRSIAKAIESHIFKYGIKKASVIIAQTQFQEKLLEKYFSRKSNFYIPVGSPFPKQLRHKKKKVEILWVANIKPLKQPELFVKLANELNNINASFIMVGAPQTSKKKYDKLLDSIESVPNLKYLGGVTQREVNQLLEEGHILVNTSLYEGFSNTFVQAWMRRVPVVSLNTDPDDVLINEGIGFHSKSFKQLCSDVELLIRDKELRERMGDHARIYAKHNHTDEQMVQNILNVLECK